MSVGAVGRMVWGEAAPVVPEVTATAAQVDPLNVYAGLQEGMTQRDLGSGKYEILDAEGAALGIGYKAVGDAYWEVGKANFAKMLKPIWEEPEPVAQTYSWQGGSESAEGSSEEAYARAEQKFAKDSAAYELAKAFWQDGDRDVRMPSSNPWSAGSAGSKLYTPTGDALSDWEGLGQVLNGSTAVGISNKLASNNKDEQVLGANTLYGSTPVFGKDEAGKMKLLGYRTDLTPGAESNSRLKDKSSDDTVEYSYVARSMNDPEGWGKVALVGENGASFIGVENVDKIPGWTNKDKSAYKHSGNGLFGGAFDLLDKTLDKINPLHDKLQEIVADGLGFDTQKQAFTTIAPLVVSYFFPAAGGALSAAEAVHNGDPVGLFLGTLSAGMGYSELSPAAASGVANAGTTVQEVVTKFNKLSLSDLGVTGMPKLVDKTVMDAARGAVKAAVVAGVSGKDLEEVFRTALSGAVVSAAGSLIGQTTGSSAAGTAAGAVTNGLIKQNSQPVAQGAPKKPSTTATPSSSSNFSVGSVGRMIWS